MSLELYALLLSPKQKQGSIISLFYSYIRWYFDVIAYISEHLWYLIILILNTYYQVHIKYCALAFSGCIMNITFKNKNKMHLAGFKF